MLKRSVVLSVLLSAMTSCGEPPIEALFAAIAAGDIELVDAMISRGIDVNQKSNEIDGDGTPLMAAVVAGYPGIVQALLDAGADPNATDSAGWSALLWVQDEDCAVILLDGGADPQWRSHSGETALMYSKTPRVAELLIKAGSDLQARRDDGQTARQVIASSESPFRVEICEVLDAAIAGRIQQ